MLLSKDKKKKMREPTNKLKPWNFSQILKTIVLKEKIIKVMIDNVDLNYSITFKTQWLLTEALMVNLKKNSM